MFVNGLYIGIIVGMIALTVAIEIGKAINY